MPYIKEARREQMNLALAHPTTAGDLNYCFTSLIVKYLWRERDSKGKFKSKYNYQDINDILGALEGAKSEFYRRVVVPYEQGKIQTNGDVY